MSWLDGMVEEGEAASQDQRLDRTAEKLRPGFFAGALDVVGPNLLRGGIEAANSVASSLVNIAGTEVMSTLATGLGAGYTPGFDAERHADDAAKGADELSVDIGRDTADSVKDLRPDPAQVGMAGLIIGELSAILPRTIVGALTAGPVGAAVAAGAPAGYSRTQTSIAEGIDDSTAIKLGMAEGLTTGAGAILPAARFVGPVLGDAAIAVGANVGLGIAHRGASAEILRASGYHAQAAQYEMLNKTALATDLVMGLAFFGLGRATYRRPTTEQIDAALTDRNAQHADADTAPGAPIDARSAVAHQDALRAAIDSINRGEPIVLPDNIHAAEFMRAAEEPTVAAKTPDKTDEAGLEIDVNENSFRYVIKDKSAADQSHLPGVIPHEIGRIVGNVTPKSIKVTTSWISDGYSGKGVGTNAYAKLADQAHESGRTLVSDVEVTQAAARVYEKLAERGYKVTRNPKAKLEDVDGLKKWISPSGPVFKVERQPAKAPAATTPRHANERAAREEIDTLVREHEATLPREPVVPAPRSDLPPGGKPAEPIVATPGKSGPDVVSSAGKPAGDGRPTAEPPELQMLRDSISRNPDTMVNSGFDADGVPLQAKASDVLAAIEVEHRAGVREAQSYMAAITCLLGG